MTEDKMTKKNSGLLIVVEGPDSSGRTTQISMLASWLEQRGYAVTQTGLKRSELVAEDLEMAKQGNVLSPRTLSLFYATDFYDQLENRIIPMLNAGHIVLADRYFYTLVVRDVVRGAKPEWIKDVYSRAITPDAIFFLKVPVKIQLDRTLIEKKELNYWESGMDTGFSRDWHDSFIKYQTRMGQEFLELGKHNGFVFINGNRSLERVNRDLKSRIEVILTNKINKEEKNEHKKD
ncbi:MAG: thymidylate kinase [Caldiserica bacterium]|nr:thymidylate kinase [Caldisericota bacterium]